MTDKTYLDFSEKMETICNHHVKCDFCFNEEISEDNEMPFDFYQEVLEKGWRFIALWKTSRKNTSITNNEGFACPNCIKEFENE